MQSNQYLQEPDKKSSALLSIGHFVSDSYGGFINPIMPLLAATMGFSLATATTIISLSSLSSSLLQPVFGYISDRVQRRFFLFSGLLVATIFMSLIGKVSNIFLLTLVLVLGYMGVGLFHPQATALLSVFSGNKVNSYMGIFTACGTLGYALGPVASSTIVEKFGFDNLHWAMIPGLLYAIIMYKFLPKIPFQHKEKEETSIKEVFEIIFKDIKLLSLTVIAIIKGLLVITFCVLMPFIIKKLGLSFNIYEFEVGTTMLIGITLSLFSAFGGFGSFSGGIIADRTSEKFVFYSSLLPTTPILIASLLLINKLPLLGLLLFVISGFFIMLSVSVNIVMAQKLAPKNTAMVSGIIGGFSWGIAAILLTPVGFLAEKIGTDIVLIFVSFAALLGSFLIKFIFED